MSTRTLIVLALLAGLAILTAVSTARTNAIGAAGPVGSPAHVAAMVDGWVRASRRQRPALDEEALSATLLRYKGAEAGEIDWRPTETVPEDYYAL